MSALPRPSPQPLSRAAGEGLFRPVPVEGWVLRGLVMAALAALVLIILLPLASLLAQSVLDGQGRFVGIAHFTAHFATGRWSALINSVSLSALSAVICVVLAYGYAWALTHTALPVKGLWRGLALLPLLAPSLLAAIGLVYAFGNQGLLKGAMQAFGIESIYGPAGIVAGSVLWTFPHALLILTTTLSTSDARLIEAARCLGADGWRVFRTVTLPASRYGLLISLVVVFVLVLTDFGVPKVVGGQTAMLATDIYKEVVGQQRLDRGAVVALLLLIPALGAFVLEQRLRARQRAVLSLRAVPHQPQANAAVDLAAMAYCGLVASALVGVFGIAVYASFAQYWPYQPAPTLSHYQFDMSDGGGWASYWNSLRMAGWTALTGTMLSFLLAWMVDKPRELRAARGVLNALATLPMAVPGLALGLGYILFFNAPWNPLRGWYGGLGILVLCTVAHYYSVAHLTQLGALRQLDPEYERVAESLGLPFWRHLWRVHLPIAVPTLVQVAGYFFVSALTTVSAVVFLYSPDTALAAIAVLAMDDAGDTAPAAAMATLLFGTAAIGRGGIGVVGDLLVQRTQRWRAR